MAKGFGSRGMGGMGGVGKANAKVYMEKQTGVTFADNEVEEHGMPNCPCATYDLSLIHI